MKSFKQHLDERCWPGHKPVPGKKPYSPGSCRKEEVELEEASTPAQQAAIAVSMKEKGIKPKVGKQPKGEYERKVDKYLRKKYQKEETELDETAAWQRKEGKNPEGGLNRKGIESYRRENPGSKLSMAVTTPPSKLKPGSKAAKRRKSFCARMGGMPGPMKDEKGRPTRKALSLRKWNC
jgi:hypothetical protein